MTSSMSRFENPEMLCAQTFHSSIASRTGCCSLRRRWAARHMPQAATTSRSAIAGPASIAWYVSSPKPFQYVCSER